MLNMSHAPELHVSLLGDNASARIVVKRRGHFLKGYDACLFRRCDIQRVDDYQLLQVHTIYVRVLLVVGRC